jgi:predicted transcriptional regulator
MFNTIKALIQKFLKSIENSIKAPKDIKPCSEKTIALESYNNQPPISERLKMLHNPDLLTTSFEDAQVINQEFCAIKISDTLAQALSLVTLLNPSDLIVLDNGGKFLGIVSSLSVVLEFTPQLQNVPFKYKHKTIKISQASEFILVQGQKTIEEVFSLEKSYCFFQKRKQVDYALDEFCKLYRAPEDQSFIPILNDDRTIIGVVTCKEILKYLSNDRLLDESKVEKLLEKLSSAKMFLDQLYTLLPEDTLESALYAFSYLPIEYILICDADKNLLGLLNREKVLALAHRMYYHLMNILLEEIMQPVSSLYLVQPTNNLKEIIRKFLESDTEVSVVMDSFAGQIPEMVITPRTILQFVK